MTPTKGELRSSRRKEGKNHLKRCTDSNPRKELLAASPRIKLVFTGRFIHQMVHEVRARFYLIPSLFKTHIKYKGFGDFAQAVRALGWHEDSFEVGRELAPDTSALSDTISV